MELELDLDLSELELEVGGWRLGIYVYRLIAALDGHTQDTARAISGHVIEAGVETRVGVGVRHVHQLAVFRTVASQACSDAACQMPAR